MADESDGGFTPAPPANRWVGDWSARRARLSPDRVGLVDATTGREFTYRALDERANRAARLLRQAGVGKGDRVVTLSRNRPVLVDLFFATGKLGAVLAPLSHRLAPPTLAEMTADVVPTVVVCEAAFADLASDVLARTEHDPTVFVVGDTDADDGRTDDERSTGDATRDEAAAGDGADGEPTDDAADTPTAIDDRWRARLPADESAVERPDVSMSDPHLFLHTGGSTGTPKETVIPHRSIYWNSFNTITAWGLRPDDTTPMTFPMFHTGGWNVLTVPLFHLGGTVVISREVDPGRLLRLIEERDASVVIAVPAVLRAMVEHERWAETDLSSLRFAKSGGGPARSATIDAWWDRGVELSQGYGLTECGPNNFAMPDGWDREQADGVGVPAMHVDARVVDEDTTPLPPGEIGELELSGPHAADRYWHNASESRATFGPSGDDERADVTTDGDGSADDERADATTDGDGSADDASPDDPADDASPDESSDDASDAGWVSTGDLARVDADGHYHIEGRKKNMFTSGGENVYPPEVEDAITDHPDVAEAVVIGVPDEQWGTVGKAVIAGADSLTLDALREFLDDRLARFKHPRALAHTDEIPTSGPSKIDRTAVEREFGE